MSGWDLFNAIVDISIYSELSGMRNDADNEKIRIAIITIKRKFIYDIHLKLQEAAKQIEAFPIQVFILSRTLGFRFLDSQITPDDFDDLADLNLLTSTVDQLDDVVKTSRAALTQPQIEQAELAAKYLYERPLLEQAIVSKTAHESLIATDEQWKDISGQQNKKRLLMGLAIAGAVFTVCVACPMLYMGYASMATGMLAGGDFFSTSFGLIMCLIGAVIPMGAIAFFLFGRKPNPEFAPLKSNRETWKKELIAQDKWQKIVSIFGDMSSEEFKKLYEERTIFINQIFGDDLQRNLKSG